MRALLEEAAPDVDLGEEWADLAPRLDAEALRSGAAPPSGRGQGRRAWVAAAAAVVVVGAGAMALRPSPPRAAELGVGSEAPVGSAAPALDPTVIASAPDSVELSCSNGVGTIDTPVVAARAAGVQLVVSESSDSITTFEGTGGLGLIIEMMGSATGGLGGNRGGTLSNLVPGTYELKCGTPTEHGTEVFASLEVTDPSGHFSGRPEDHPWACPMPPGEPWMDRAAAHSETYLGGAGSYADEVAALVAWRVPSAEVRVTGYVGGPTADVSVRRGDEVVASGSASRSGSVKVSLSFCHGVDVPLPVSGPSPSLSTEAAALAWLDAQLAVGVPYVVGIPADATGVQRHAKLIRQDDIDNDSAEVVAADGPRVVNVGIDASVSLSTVSPGFLGWVARVTYTDAAGDPGSILYTFGADGNTETLRSSAETPAVAEIRAATFAALPDRST